MIVEIIPPEGIGRSQPLVLRASQLVVRLDNGTPIYACACFGPDKTYAHSIAGLEDFQRILRALGVNMTVIVNKIQMPAPPPGARLIAGPTFQDEGGNPDGQ